MDKKLVLSGAGMVSLESSGTYIEGLESSVLPTLRRSNNRLQKAYFPLVPRLGVHSTTLAPSTAILVNTLASWENGGLA